MYLMAGPVAGFICNLLVRPVAERYSMPAAAPGTPTPTAAAANPAPAAERRAAVTPIGADGVDLGVRLIIVGI